jgi:hypothetical protein
MNSEPVVTPIRSPLKRTVLKVTIRLEATFPGKKLKRASCVKQGERLDA